ncbi:helix-turn-helix domain-containing protein [Cupriavidus gilardii]|uniref:helix-turn-helix domain-containing protein n=1 Tax=Cupriavidus gilardii TaxID=82541 RepID=UPI0015740C78|nr:helix-turn-helix transcriptional regulator [Cupriavidus gilardii]NSX05897.1 helix-turn-helix transcriptional regulator [Cupriavidus gilardii]
MIGDPLKLFGQRLTALRKQRGWSQEKLALESGMARSYLSGIERGLRNVALINICTLADTLGVPPSEMLKFDSENSVLAVEELRTPFGAEETTAQRNARRYMARLDNDDQDLVASVARALARKRSVGQNAA